MTLPSAHEASNFFFHTVAAFKEGVYVLSTTYQTPLAMDLDEIETVQVEDPTRIPQHRPFQHPRCQCFQLGWHSSLRLNSIFFVRPLVRTLGAPS